MRILVVRFSSIGDIVLTSPVVRCLKKQLPDTQIHYLTKRTYEPLLDSNPYIDKIHLFDDDLGNCLKELKGIEFDLVVDLHHNLRSLQVKRAISAPAKSFNKLNIQKWLLTNFKIDLLPAVHIVDRYMDTVAHLGVVNDGAGLDHFIPPGEAVDLSMLPSEFAQGYTALGMGAKFGTKRMPEEMLMEVCKRNGLPVVLLGGPEDEPIGARVATAVGSNVLNGCGRFSINQSASLVEQATNVITHDTGIMHIAAAFDKDITSVWGNTVPKFGMGPYLPTDGNGSSRIVEADISCRPCSKLGHAKCPKGHFNCMNSLRVADITSR